jgi:hypothetical protein
MQAGSETNGAKYGTYLVVPVTWAPTETIKSFEKKPIFVLGRVGVPRGRSDNSYFLSWKNALTEGVFAISLFEGPTMLGRHANQEPETVKPENRCEAVAFRPVAGFTIAQNDDTRFGPKWHQLLILFDSEDTHLGDGFRSAFLTKSPVFSQSYLSKCAHVFDTALLLVITLEPDLTIGVSRGQGLQEAGRAVPM